MNEILVQKIHDLYEISEIYKNAIASIQHDPNLINIEVLSRLNCRLDFRRVFDSPCGLHMISNAYIQNEITNNLFVASTGSCVYKFHSQFNGPYVFIECLNLTEQSITTFSIIESTKRNPIYYVNLKRFVQSIRILIDDSFSERNLNGILYFREADNLYHFDFCLASPSLLMTFESDIKEIILISSSYLLVVLTNTLKLLFIGDKKKKIVVKEEYKEEGTIDLIESNIPNQTVFSSDFTKTFECVTILVGVSELGYLKIFKFNCKDSSFSLISKVEPVKWTNYGFGNWVDREITTWKDTIVIEQAYMIHNYQSIKENHLIRFAVQEETCNETIDESKECCIVTTVKVIEVHKDGLYKVTEIREDLLKINKNDKFLDIKDRCLVHTSLSDEDEEEDIKITSQLELVGFLENRLVFKLRTSFKKWLLIFYNLNDRVVLKRGLLDTDRVHLIEESGLFVSQGLHEMHIYEMKGNELFEVANIDIPFTEEHYNDVKTDFKFLTDKLLRIEPLSGESIKEIYFKKSKLEDTNRLDKNIDCALDKEHVLIWSVVKSGDDKNVFRYILNVEKQVIVNSFCTIVPYMGMRLGVNQKYCVFLDYICMCIKIYKMQKIQDSYVASEVYKEILDDGIDTDMFVNSTKCHFLKTKASRDLLIITLLNKTADCIEVRFIADRGGMLLKTGVFTYELANIELKQRNMFCCITHKNRYLVLRDSCERNNVTNLVIYYIDIVNRKLMGKLLIENEEIFEIEDLCVPKSDDFIVRTKGVLYYVYYNVVSNKLDKKALKKYEGEWRFMMKNNYLIICMFEEHHMELYRLNKVRTEKALNNPFTINRAFVKYPQLMISVSLDGKFLAFQGDDCCLYIYNLHRKKQTASIQLNQWLEDLVMTQDYLCLKFTDISELIIFQLTSP